MNTIDLSLFKSYYEESFITRLVEIYDNSIKNIEGNTVFFKNPGKYINLNNPIETDGCTYFKNKLFIVNIEFLDYILKNISIFKDKIFLDYASGFGILSVLLKKIGITCHNYDTFKQMNQDYIEKFLEEVNSKFNYNITVTNKLPKLDNDVICCAGYWLEENPTSEYMLLDSRYDNKYPTHTLIDHHIVDTYNYSRVYKRNY